MKFKVTNITKTTKLSSFMSKNACSKMDESVGKRWFERDCLNIQHFTYRGIM